MYVCINSGDHTDGLVSSRWENRNPVLTSHVNSNEVPSKDCRKWSVQLTNFQLHPSSSALRNGSDGGVHITDLGVDHGLNSHVSNLATDGRW